MKLYCSFVQGGNHGFIFQNGHGENPDRRRSQPSRAPSPRISPEEEARIIRRQGEIVGADADSNLEQVILHEEAVRLEQIRQNKFQQIVINVQGLQDEIATFFRNKDIRTNPVEHERLTERMQQLVQDVNNDLGLGLNLSGAYGVEIEVKEGGLLLCMSALAGNKLHETYVGIRPDGTYEKLVLERFMASEADTEVAQGRNPNEKLTYFDSRTNESSQYDLPALAREDIMSSAQKRDLERFNLDRGGRTMPFTE